MGSWGDDVGLLYLVLLNAAVLIASWRLARRRSADALDAAGDAFLLFYFVQYASVCLTGLAGAMHALTIGLVALLASAFIALGSWRIKPREVAEEDDAARRRDEATRDVARGEHPEDARGDVTLADREDVSRAVARETGAGDVAGVTRETASGRTQARRATAGRETAAQAPARVRTRARTTDDDPSSATWRQLWLRRGSRVIATGAIAFVVGYIATLVVHQRRLPVISNDAITYHLPAAVQWLQTGRLGLYEAWYYNPANSYSPLAGSAFIAWLIAPVQNDSIARFVAVGPLLMLLVAMLNVCRRLGVDRGVAALVAAACVLARPFASHAILAKDDLFVAAFFIVLVDALSRARFSTRSGPFRVGIALGLLLATKYTVLFSLPLLLLMFNGAWTLRRMLTAAGVALLIAGPWYLRNWKMTGNPLYPAEVTLGGVTIFSGMLEIARSRLLATPRGVWEVFVEGYYGLTAPIAIVLIVGWAAAVVVMLLRRSRARDGAPGGREGTRDVERPEPAPARVPRRGLTDPLLRTCVIGPIIGVAIFAFAAPYGEMRFAYPSVALLFACLAIALARWPRAAQATVAAAMMLLAAFTAFRPQATVMFVATGAALALPAMLVALTPRRIAKRMTYAAGGAVILALGMYAYVDWQRYVRQTAADSVVTWANRYGPIGELWDFVRTSDTIAGAPRAAGDAGGGTGAGSGATIAYANTFFTYPLMGYRYEHRVVHVSTRGDVERFRELPPLSRKVTGEEIVTEVVSELRQRPDRTAWLRRLRESGAQFLVVAKYDPSAPSQRVVAPEMTFAEQDPQRFVRVFDNDAGSVFRIAW